MFGDRKDSYDGRDTGEATSGDLRSQRALANLTIDQMEGDAQYERT